MKLELTTTIFEAGKAKTQPVTREFQPDSGVEMHAVNLYPQVQDQVFEGFGGAITEAAGYAFSRMGEHSRKEILDACFGEGGNNYRLARMAVDSCDFALGNYSAVTDPQDTELKTFSLNRDEEYILPLLRAAQRTARRQLGILLSPWSPRAVMMTIGEKNHGGTLKPEYREMWAEYLCRYVEEYRGLGLDVRMLTIQNEPNASQPWDSCRYGTEEEKVFLRDYLYPAARRHHLDDLQICIWDHNKERVFERACGVIDDVTDSMVNGVAFHWYSGDHFDAVRLVHEKFPDKKLIFSEGCVEYSNFDKDNQLANAQMYAHDIIGNLNAGTQVFLDWNIVLDENGGPNHVNNFCDAPILCDTANDRVIKKLSYEYIGHFSRYIQNGATRIESSKNTDRLELTAFENPNGSLAAVFLNRTEKELPVSLRLRGSVTDFVLPPCSISTAQIG